VLVRSAAEDDRARGSEVSVGDGGILMMGGTGRGKQTADVGVRGRSVGVGVRSRRVGVGRVL
jgi:ATP:corrinoid adenosyltransferase